MTRKEEQVSEQDTDAMIHDQNTKQNIGHVINGVQAQKLIVKNKLERTKNVNCKKV